VASAFVVLEGSVGTMAELFLTWNLLAVDGRPQAPLICLGGPYEGFMRAVTAPGLVLPDLGKFVEVAHSPEDAVARIVSALAKA
jgi:predicted Rossmann-fold nucleotide-binding protein